MRHARRDIKWDWISYALAIGYGLAFGILVTVAVLLASRAHAQPMNECLLPVIV